MKAAVSSFQDGKTALTQSPQIQGVSKSVPPAEIFKFLQATVGTPMQALGTLAVLMTYGTAMIPLAYCASMAMSTPSEAFIVLAITNTIFGFCVSGSYVSVHTATTEIAPALSDSSCIQVIEVQSRVSD